MEAIFEDSKGVHLVLRYAKNGSLYQNLAERKETMEEKDLKNNTAQLLLALNYMHEN